jgi:hypothetical protein
VMALLGAIRSYRSRKGFDLGGQLARYLEPAGWGDLLTVVGVVVVGAAAGLMVAAALVARRQGMGSSAAATSYNL